MTKGKKILAHAVLILASFLSVFPLYYMLCGATNTSIDVVLRLHRCRKARFKVSVELPSGA